MESWITKYRPKSTKEVIGRQSVIERLRDFITNYTKQKKKAVILHGAPGGGKTSTVYAIANELQLEVLEVNASDFRNKAIIESVIGGALKQRSLFSQGKLILVDEVDGLSGTKDRGGIAALTSIIKESSFPVICTANDAYNKKMNTLRKSCELIELKTLAYTSIFNKLKMICENEGVTFDEMALKSLARLADGDMRAAINDLQTLTQAKKTLVKEDLDELGDRNRTETMFNALIKVFKTTNSQIARTAFDDVSEDMDQVFLWIDENLPREYTKPQDLARAYDKLSKADVYRRRIRRWQHWRFMVYIYALLSAGVAVSKDEKYKGFVNYQPTKRILKLWQAKMKYAKRAAIAQKIADVTHTSSRRVIKDTLPFVQQMMKKDPSYVAQFTEEFDLDKDEVTWLTK